jgi:hypothetical protein
MFIKDYFKKIVKILLFFEIITIKFFSLTRESIQEFNRIDVKEWN